MENPESKQPARRPELFLLAVDYRSERVITGDDLLQAGMMRLNLSPKQKVPTLASDSKLVWEAVTNSQTPSANKSASNFLTRE